MLQYIICIYTCQMGYHLQTAFHLLLVLFSAWNANFSRSSMKFKNLIKSFFVVIVVVIFKLVQRGQQINKKQHVCM